MLPRRKRKHDYIFADFIILDEQQGDKRLLQDVQYHGSDSSCRNRCLGK